MLIKYEVKIKLNLKGSTLLNKSEFTTTFDSNTTLDYSALKEKLYDVIPKELCCDESTFDCKYYTKYADIQVGCYLIIHIDETSYSASEYVSKVKEVTSKGFKLENFDYLFDFNGECVTRKKKNIPYIRPLTDEEMKVVLEDNKKKELLDEISTYFEYETDGCNVFSSNKLSCEQLVAIRDICKGLYCEYGGY